MRLHILGEQPSGELTKEEVIAKVTSYSVDGEVNVKVNGMRVHLSDLPYIRDDSFVTVSEPVKGD